MPNLWYNFEIQVIPYGLGNRHFHPQKDVYGDILRMSKLLLSATQNQGVRYKIDVALRDYDEDEDLEDIQPDYTKDPVTI